jgi:DNA adenine methylase
MRPLLKVETASSDNVVDLGLACLFYNRSNFSGILAAGPIGGMEQKSVYTIDCRTNKDEIIVRLLAAATFANAVDVRHCDAAEYLLDKHGGNRIFYVDPPYFVKGELLYRHFYKMGDHKRLASSLSSLNQPWFLSYDVHHVIEYLYEGFHINKLSFRYSAHSPKNHDELLISNFPISAEVIESPIVRSARQAHSVGTGFRAERERLQKAISP